MAKLQDIIKQTTEQNIKDKIYIDKLNSSNISFDTIANSLPSDLKQTAQDKVNTLTLNKVNELKSLVEDKINELLSQLESSAACPDERVLNVILGIRDGILSQINKTSTNINRTKKGLNSLKDLVDKQVQAIDVAQTVKTAAQITKSAAVIAQGTLPAVPGFIASTISIADTTIQLSDDIIKFLQFDKEGKVKIPELKTQISKGLFFTNLSSQLILPLVDKLKSIDSILEKCGKKVSSIPQDIISLTQTQDTINNSSKELINYQGFILEIIEKQFDRNLIQKIGVAKDSQGVILLQTQPSFTSNPNTLIEEIKFLIDKNNLKTY